MSDDKLKNDVDYKKIIDALMPFIIGFVYPKELAIELCSIADGDTRVTDSTVKDLLEKYRNKADD